MNILAAGQFKLDDWIQIIIVILVVGGSAFGAVGKKLIKMFTPEESHGETARRGAAGSGHAPPGAPRRSVQPAHPVARPMPSSPLPGSIPPAGPLGKPPVSRSQPELPPYGPPSPKRTARPIPSRRRATPRPATAEGRLGHLISAVEQTGGLDEATAEQRLGHLESAVKQRGDSLEAAVEQRLGHVESGLEKRPGAARGPLPIPVIGRPTPQTLRQGIVLREILGPPVSLRPPNDEERF